ncbi:protein XRP2 [Daphnia magna]|uniref:Putative Tubulin-specific chaperone C n=1 Tax=Daphnia magna TaxID=35525 RepID=A0A0P4XW23_9CRUS|nr:protein XRP2 [Daphnia magna]KZS14193.1 putative Tubulin-specific chaperone C [Daphnia magna]
MGNVFNLIHNWISSRCDDYANNVTIPIRHGNSIPIHPPVYSWDRKTDTDASQFRLENLNGQFICRTLVNQGQQFTIEGCKRSLILVTGSFDSVFVDDCIDCKIILGPVRGSVFLRSCSECFVVTTCGQLRTRDCNEITCYIFCASQPSIEVSYAMKFQCISLDYPGQRDDFANARLNAKIANRWSEIFDFTPSSLSSNWRLLSVEDRVEDHLDKVELLHCINHQITFNRTLSLIPFTHPALNIFSRDDLLGKAQYDMTGKF